MKVEIDYLHHPNRPKIYYIFQEIKGGHLYLRKSGHWMESTLDGGDNGLYKTKKEAQAQLNKWLETLTPEQFAEYAADRMKI